MEEIHLERSRVCTGDTLLHPLLFSPTAQLLSFVPKCLSHVYTQAALALLPEATISWKPTFLRSNLIVCPSQDILISRIFALLIPLARSRYKSCDNDHNSVSSGPPKIILTVSKSAKRLMNSENRHGFCCGAMNVEVKQIRMSLLVLPCHKQGFSYIQSAHHSFWGKPPPLPLLHQANWCFCTWISGKRSKGMLAVHWKFWGFRLGWIGGIGVMIDSDATSLCHELLKVWLSLCCDFFGGSDNNDLYQ